MKVVQYWAARTVLFLAVLAVLALVGWWDLFSVLAAAVVAGLVSYAIWPGMRQAAAVQLAGWLDRPSRRHHLDDAAEDAEAAGP